jgi:hypothetical protein
MTPLLQENAATIIPDFVRAVWFGLLFQRTTPAPVGVTLLACAWEIIRQDDDRRSAQAASTDALASQSCIIKNRDDQL